MRRRLASFMMAIMLVVATLPMAAAEGWAAIKAPFTGATVESVAAGGLTYTDDWSGKDITVDVYRIKTPEADTITLDFGSTECVAYQYADAAKEKYKGACAESGDYADNGKTGETKAVIRKYDGAFPEYVFVQTPYDENWASTDLYAIQFVGASAPGQVVYNQADLAKTRAFVKKKIVNKYGSEWFAMALARDGQAVSDDYWDSLSDEITARQGSMATSSSNYSNNAKVALTLTSGGYNALWGAGDFDILDNCLDVAKVEAQGVNGAIYALLALDCYDYIDMTGYRNTRNEYVNYIMNSINDAHGLWDYGYGATEPDIDLTAMAVIALAPYKSKSNVKEVIDKALAYFETQRNADGTYTSWGTANANSTACVVMAMAANGVDPTESATVGKAAAIDGLDKFALADGSFGYDNNKTYNQMATEQAYMALIDAARFKEGKNSFYKMSDVSANESLPIMRCYGASRYDTSIMAARIYKYFYDYEGHLDNIIVASGENFPDALTGSYLSAVYLAPVVLVSPGTEAKIKAFIDENLADDGTVYILGGTGAVSSRFEKSLSNFNVKRLAGANRYSTNIEIHKEGIKGDSDIDTLIVSTGSGYADSLSVSSTGEAIMIVGDKLTAEQKKFLSTFEANKVYAIGGTAVLSDSVMNSVLSSMKKGPGNFKRLAGANRYATSVAVADEFYGPDTFYVTLAYGGNFPDGLSGGALAYMADGPLLLVSDSNYKDAQIYCSKLEDLEYAQVMGGHSLISNKTVRAIVNG